MTETSLLTGENSTSESGYSADFTFNKMKTFLEKDFRERLENLPLRLEAARLRIKAETGEEYPPGLTPPKHVVENWEARFEKIVEPMCDEFTNRWYDELYPTGEHSIPDDTYGGMDFRRHYYFTRRDSDGDVVIQLKILKPKVFWWRLKWNIQATIAKCLKKLTTPFSGVLNQG